MWSPHIEPGEALQAMVSHFADCIRGSAEPVSDGRLGVRVVRLLEAATRSIRAQGGRVVLSSGEFTHGDGSARAIRSGEVQPGLSDRAAGAERGDPLFRQPVR